MPVTLQINTVVTILKHQLKVIDELMDICIFGYPMYTEMPNYNKQHCYTSQNFEIGKTFIIRFSIHNYDFSIFA